MVGGKKGQLAGFLFNFTGEGCGKNASGRGGEEGWTRRARPSQGGESCGRAKRGGAPDLDLGGRGFWEWTEGGGRGIGEE